MRKRCALLMCLVTALLPAVATALPKGEAILLMEPLSGAVLLEEGADAELEAAGLFRLPALLYVCEAMDAGKVAGGDEILVSENAAATGGATLFLSPYERMEAGSLLKGAVVIMAGDALYALTEHLEADEGAFVAAVNTRMRALNAQVTYTERLGSGKMTAGDAARIGAALLKSKSYCAYSMVYYDTLQHENGQITELASANKLLKSMAGCNGVATGSSDKAGYCGVFSAKRGETEFLCTVMGAKSASVRAETAASLLEQAFSAYQVKNVAKRGDVFASGVPVEGGTALYCDLVAAGDVRLVLPATKAYTEARNIPQSLKAPLRAGEVLGTVSCLDADGGLLARVDLVVCEDIPQAQFKDHFVRVRRSFLHL